MQKAIRKMRIRKLKYYLEKQIDNDHNKREHTIGKKVHKRINKNAPKNFDVNLIAYQYFEGVDLMAIRGVSHSTILSIMSEVGLRGIKKV